NKKQKCDHKQNKVLCKPEVAKPIIKDDIIFDPSRPRECCGIQQGPYSSYGTSGL
ncbi:29829_t:CDS:2, partial [Racocetra persica]